MASQLGEIVLIRMRFHQSAGAKVRPAVVLLDTGDDDLVVAPITSQLRTSEFDLSIAKWNVAGLNTASFVRIHKLTVLSKADVIRIVGLLAEDDRARLTDVLCSAFCARS
jgi:mRNA interferase MazF